MIRKQIKTAHPTQNRIEVTDYENGNVFIEVGSAIQGTSQLSKEGAHDLIRLLTEAFGAPAKPTFQSQFAELEVGEQFVILPAYSPGERSNAVKIDEERFFNYKKNWVKRAGDLVSHSRIERIPKS